MRPHILIAMTVLLWLSPAGANQLTLEFGTLLSSSTTKPPQPIVLAKYRLNYRVHYLETGLGQWFGSRHSGIMHGSIGLHFRNFSIGTGIAGITHKISGSQTNLQIISSARLTLEPIFNIFISATHISNGRDVFNLSVSGISENLITFGYIFKL